MTIVFVDTAKSMRAKVGARPSDESGKTRLLPDG
jgi:hypothetical protein